MNQKLALSLLFYKEARVPPDAPSILPLRKMVTVERTSRRIQYRRLRIPESYPNRRVRSPVATLSRPEARPIGGRRAK